MKEIDSEPSFIVLQKMISDIRESLNNVHESLSGILLNEADEGQKEINEGINGIEKILNEIISEEDDTVLKDSVCYRDIHEGLYYIKEGFNNLNNGLNDIHRGIYEVFDGFKDIH